MDRDIKRTIMVDTHSATNVLQADSSPRSARPAWRRRLIDIERGITLGVRGDSVFFVYFFLSSLTIAASLVLGISLLEWTVVILALTVVLCAEMFNQSVKSLRSEERRVG